jgi:hypothetical protein
MEGNEGSPTGVERQVNQAGPASAGLPPEGGSGRLDTPLELVFSCLLSARAGMKAYASPTIFEGYRRRLLHES